MSEKEVEDGAYKAGVIDFNAKQRRFVVPYTKIIATLKNGGDYVLPATFEGKPLSAYTIDNALRRLRKTLPSINKGTIKETGQTIYYLPENHKEQGGE